MVLDGLLQSNNTIVNGYQHDDGNRKNRILPTRESSDLNTPNEMPFNGKARRLRNRFVKQDA
jgi:hypothetical protein